MQATYSAGDVSAIHRYPVKSMMGEAINSTEIDSRGLRFDRAFALADPATSKVVSAKHPQKWPALFAFRASLTGEHTVAITFPDGRVVNSDHPELEATLSRAVGRPVKFLSASPVGATLEEYWPDMVELPKRDIVTDEAMPPGTFFDCAAVHLLTTATLAALGALYPQGRFEPRRFRPNLIVSTPESSGFAENEWIGKSVTIGETVELKITGPCPRCVMTTLAQDDLPRDPMVLRTAAQHNGAHVGVYASVTRGGTIRRGDAIQVH